MSDDTIFREVDEAVRQDQLKALWNKYGLFVVAGAVLIVAGVAGYRGWEYWRATQAADSGARFEGALSLAEQGQPEDARAALRSLAADGPRGYRMLARFQLAAADAQAGNRERALQAYEALAGDGSVGPILQDHARVQAAALRVDEADLAEMGRRVGALADGSGPWRHSARELLGLVAYRTGDTAEAERRFTEIMSDAAAPANLRRRAEMMLALIVRADATPAS